MGANIRFLLFIPNGFVSDVWRGVTNRIKPGKTGVLTHDFSRGPAHHPFVCPTVLTVSKYDLAIETDKSV